MAVTCPTCGGPWWPAHPFGLLTFQHEPSCTIRRRLDARLIADRYAAKGRNFRRPSTGTERMLLHHIGATGTIDENLATHVAHRSPAIVELTWPSLTYPPLPH